MLRIIYRRTLLRQFVLLGIPITLALLELKHPTHFADNVFQGLENRVALWLYIHFAQLPLFGLLALSVCVLVYDLPGPAAVVSRCAMCVFVVFYTALDAVDGIAVGILIQNAQKLPIDQQTDLAKEVQGLFFDNRIMAIGAIGAIAWFIGMIATAIAIYQVNGSWPPLILLILAGIFFALGHPPPRGPIGLTCFFVAVFWLERKGLFPLPRGETSLAHKRSPPR